MSSSSAPAGAAAPVVDRNRGLDGLRGLAALIVVFHHQLLTLPALANAYVDPRPAGGRGWSWWLTYTPLHLLWDGTEAVFVFFVLSGYVLTLPVLRIRSGPWWIAYYPRRLVRLYLPSAGAILFALITVVLVHRHAHPVNSWWVNTHATQPHGLRQGFHDARLVSGTGWLDSPLWSLRYEVMFSALLPLYVYVARRVTMLRALQGLAVLAVVAIGAKRGSGLITYLPMFALGVLMAFERERLSALAARISRRTWWLLLAGALICLNAYWTVFAISPHTRVAGYTVGASRAIAALAAALIVFLVSDWPTARSFAETRPVQWLGRRSFSLYLTHEPLIIAVAFVLGGHPNIILLLAICVPGALLLADLFYRLVEGPSHHLSQYVGRTLHSAGQRAFASRVSDGT